MSTQANLLNAATNTAGSSMAAGLHPTQQQLDELAEQTLSIIHAPKARVPQPAAAAAAAVTKPAPPCNTTAPATAPGQQDPLSGLKAQFLQQVLSLTNYSQLGSAPLLDPLIPSKNYQLMQEVVQQQQTLFCRWVPISSGHAGCCTNWLEGSGCLRSVTADGMSHFAVQLTLLWQQHSLLHVTHPGDPADISVVHASDAV
jgi:hypothetical protein